jgi:flagellar motility protein MotE (MotC chaperone)
MDTIGDLTDIDQGGAIRNKRRLPILPIALILIIVGGLTAIFGFNVFNIRDRHIYPPLRGLPIVGNLIPGGEVQTVYVDGELVEVPAEAADAAGLEESVALLTAELEETSEALRLAETLNRQYEESISVLQRYRDLVTEYRENRARFDEMIAMGDPQAFAEFYETVEPDNAARLFAQIRANQQVDREFRRYAATYAEMNTDEAAAVFTILLTTNPGLLLDILATFNNIQRAEVFNEMEAADVAVITTLMAPDTIPADILPPVPLITGGEPIPVIPVADAAEEDEIDEDEEPEEA